MDEPYRVTLRLNDKKFTVVNEAYPSLLQAQREAVYLFSNIESVVADDYSLIKSAVVRVTEWTPDEPTPWTERLRRETKNER